MIQTLLFSVVHLHGIIGQKRLKLIWMCDLRKTWITIETCM